MVQKITRPIELMDFTSITIIMVMMFGFFGGELIHMFWPQDERLTAALKDSFAACADSIIPNYNLAAAINTLVHD
jgi:hypothetical protein